MNTIYYQKFKNIIQSSPNDARSIVDEFKTPRCTKYIYEILYAMINCNMGEEMVYEVFAYHLDVKYDHLGFLNGTSEIAMEHVIRLSSAISKSQYSYDFLANWLFIQSSYGFPMEYSSIFSLIVTKKLSLSNPPHVCGFNFMMQCIVANLIEDDLFDDYLKTEKRFSEKDTIIRTIEYIEGSVNHSREEKEYIKEKLNRHYARTVLVSSK